MLTQDVTVKVRLYKCNGDCFNCIHEDCIVNNDKEIMGKDQYDIDIDSLLNLSSTRTVNNRSQRPKKFNKMKPGRYSPSLHAFVK